VSVGINHLKDKNRITETQVKRRLSVHHICKVRFYCCKFW